MLWTQTNPGLCALAQMAPRSQTTLVSGLGYAVAQATGRPPDDLCYRQRPRDLPDHGSNCCRLIKPKPFRPGRAFQNVQTPGRAVPARVPSSVRTIGAPRANPSLA